MKSFFTPKDISALVGISYRQIQYWDKTNFIKPSYRRKGRYRLYDFSDLIQLKVAKSLRNVNYTIQRLRKTIESLRSLLLQVNQPLTELTFLFQGDHILVFNGEVLMNGVVGSLYIRFDVKDLRNQVNEHWSECIDILDPEVSKVTLASRPTV